METTMMSANGAGQEPAATRSSYGKRQREQLLQQGGVGSCGGKCFQMPLHYPRYSREDYEAMPEWQLDRLLSEYGLPATGTINHKRNFAIGAFLWGGAGNGNGNH